MGVGRRRVMSALLVGLVLPLGAGAAPAAVSAAPAPCKVVNVRTAVSTNKLQVALNAAAAGDTLRITGTCTGSFTIGEGYADARKLTLIKGATAATLKGNGGRVLEVLGGTIRITGIKITGGTAEECPAPDAPPDVCGGGILNTARLTLTNVTVTGNVATPAEGSWARGGGIYTTGAIRLVRSTVSANTSTMGGGIYGVEGSAIRLVRSAVTGNTATSDTVGAEGGGIYTGGTLTLDRSTVTANVVSGASGSFGGGISGNLADISVTRSTIAGNATGGAGGPGGGIYLFQASLKVVRSTISGNVAEEGAGGAIRGESAATTITIEASTISGNRAYAIGAIDSSGPLVITGSTITRNSGDTGGINANDTLVINNSILAGNVTTNASASIDCNAAAGKVTGQHNVIGEADDCSDLVDGQDFNQVGTREALLDPKLGRLAKNGGPTKTHALLAGSPAIKAGGKPCAVSGRDQRGVARPQPAGTACDVGAFERS